jgi:signal transduction histidine kinase
MAAIIATSLLVLLVQDVPLISYLQTVEHDRIITTLERDAFVLGGKAEEALETESTKDDVAVAGLARDYRDAGGSRVVIVNTKGIAIVTSDDDQSSVGASYASRPELADALAGQINSGSRYSTTLGLQLLYVSVPIFSGDHVIGAVRLTYPEQVVIDAVNAKLSVLGIVTLTTILLAGVVGFVFSGTVTSRLRRLREATEQIANGDLAARADDKSGAPEIRSLARSLNGMTERLEALLHAQRSFAADASHQLRTPLTSLRLRLERARDLVTTDPQAASERLLAAENEAERLNTIIEGLLLLSRSEADTAMVAEFDLAEIARERVEQWEALTQELGIHLVCEAPARAAILAVASAPQQIIDNLVDNAISASGAGSVITVRVLVGAPETALHVIDNGPGLSAEDRDRAFGRFWRADTSTNGSGLGLAIVEQLARASRAHARLDAAEGGGLDASVRFLSAP